MVKKTKAALFGAEFHRLSIAGLTYSQIGKANGMNKNQVAFILRDWRALAGVSGPGQTHIEPTGKVKKFKFQPIIENVGILLDNIGQKQCRFPVGMIDGKHTFCGSEVINGKSYCQEHYVRCVNLQDKYKKNQKQPLQAETFSATV